MMIDEQLKDRGIKDPRVLRAMEEVPAALVHVARFSVQPVWMSVIVML